MSEKKTKQQRRRRAQKIMALFHFTQEQFKQKELDDPAMRLLLTMSDRKFSAIIGQSVKTLADQQAAMHNTLS